MSCTKLELPPEPLTSELPPPDPLSVCPLSSTEFVETPSPRTKFLGTPLDVWEEGTASFFKVAIWFTFVGREECVIIWEIWRKSNQTMMERGEEQP